MSISLRLSQCMISAINTIAMADMNDSFHGFFPLVLLSEVNINISINQKRSKNINKFDVYLNYKLHNFSKIGYRNSCCSFDGNMDDSLQKRVCLAR